MAGRGSLTSRVLVPEVMDDPALDDPSHQQALAALTRINRLSASAAIVWPPIRQLARRLKTDRLKILDVATGAGDVPLALAKRARQAGLRLEITGVDVSPRAIEFARQRAKSGGEGASADVTFRQLDVLTEPLPDDCDVVMCSLFLHHLETAAAERFLAAAGQAARHLVVVSDLRRSLTGWWMAYAASRLLTRSQVIHVDATRSVDAAFSMDELRTMAQSAGLSGIKIVRRWPCRMLLTAGPGRSKFQVQSSKL